MEKSAGVAEMSAVVAANRAFYHALEERDIALMDDVWCHEDRATCVHPGWRRLDGWIEIRRSWDAIFRNTDAWAVACKRERVVIEGDQAWVTCVEEIRPPSQDGSQALQMEATNIFVRRQDAWRLVHHHASPSPDAPDPGSVN
ncbi:MAG: nuclear transport factor 2 family protein [Acidobacteriota bacterium]